MTILLAAAITTALIVTAILAYAWGYRAGVAYCAAQLEITAGEITRDLAAARGKSRTDFSA